MQPQQPYGAPADPSQYSFITNPDQPRRGMGGGSMKQRLLIASLGLLVLIILATVVINLVRPKDNSIDALVGVLQQQTKLIDLTSDIPSQAGVSPSTQSSAATISLSLTSDKADLLTYLASNNQKIEAKQLAGSTDPVLKAKLASSLEAGNYDSTFKSTIKTELSTYQRLLKQAYAKVKGANGKKLLETNYNSTILLDQQLNSNGS